MLHAEIVINQSKHIPYILHPLKHECQLDMAQYYSNLTYPSPVPVILISNNRQGCNTTKNYDNVENQFPIKVLPVLTQEQQLDTTHY